VKGGQEDGERNRKKARRDSLFSLVTIHVVPIPPLYRVPCASVEGVIIAEGLAAKALVSIKLVPLSYIPVRSFMPPIGAVGEISGARVA